MRVLLELGEPTEITRSPPNALPRIEVSIETMFHVLKHENVVKVFTVLPWGCGQRDNAQALLLEQKVLLVSKYLSGIAFTMGSLTLAQSSPKSVSPSLLCSSLLHGNTVLGLRGGLLLIAGAVYIPVLPSALWEFVAAPTPFLMGIHIDAMRGRVVPSDVLVVDLDRCAAEHAASPQCNAATTSRWEMPSCATPLSISPTNSA